MSFEWPRVGWIVAAVALLGCGAAAHAFLGPLGLGLVGVALLFVASRMELDDHMPVGEDGSPCLIAPEARRGVRGKADEGPRVRAETTDFLRRTSSAKAIGFAFLAAAAALALLAD